MLPPDPVKHFLATGGEHLNSEDVFIAVKMQGNQKQIGELETKKIRQTKLQAQELAAQAIIQEHQVETKGVGSLRVVLLKNSYCGSSKASQSKGESRTW